MTAFLHSTFTMLSPLLRKLWFFIMQTRDLKVRSQCHHLQENLTLLFYHAGSKCFALRNLMVFYLLFWWDR